MKQAGTSLANHQRQFRKRWHMAPAAHSNCVHPVKVEGERTELPTTPCFLCEARGPCKHRPWMGEAA
jgi:hypothetical protein